jgi:uncharacterized protein (UPF0262 family)
MLCKPAPACGLFPSEPPRLMLVTASSKTVQTLKVSAKDTEISEQAVKTIVNDALELNTLLSSDALPVRLRISGNVMRLDFDFSAKTQEASEHIIHHILSLFILGGVVPVDGHLTETGGLREDVGDENSALAK